MEAFLFANSRDHKSRISKADEGCKPQPEDHSHLNPNSARLVSDFRVHTTVLPWHLKNWDLIKKTTHAKIFKIKNVSLANHSCNFDISLSMNEHSQVHGRFMSLLQVELHHGNGLESNFLISAYLRRHDGTKWVSASEFVRPLYDGIEVRKFWLPPWGQLSPYVVDNNLTVFISIEETIVLHKVLDDLLECDDIPALRSETFTELYKNQELVDITFIIGSNKQTLLAHSVVLAATCPYFLSMFTTSAMTEQKTRTVDLTADTDVTFEIFQGFLDYIYSVRKIEQMNDIAKGLAVLADKYGYLKLRRDCERVLCDSLNKDNVAALLLLAHQYNFQSLKSKALTLALSCELSIKDFNGPRDICQYPKLMGELMSSLSI